MIKWITIILGVAIMAAGLNTLLEPYSLVTGGATGIAVIAQSMWGIPMSVTNMAINIPLLWAAYKMYGFPFVKDTLLATVFLSAALEATRLLPVIETDIILAALFGGIMTGTGLGLVFRAGATTGGSDLAARLINKLYPQISVTKILLALDIIIIGGSALVLGVTPAMYAIVSVYVVSKLIDAILSGVDYAKAVFIISEKSHIIGKQIITDIKRGATYIKCTGIYSNREKGLLYVVVPARQLVRLKAVAENIDPAAFIIVNDVREIRGEFRR